MVGFKGTSPYDHRGKTQRHPSTSSNIGQMYKSNQNQCARQELDFINSIFKHSEGYVMTRYVENTTAHRCIRSMLKDTNGGRCTPSVSSRVGNQPPFMYADVFANSIFDGFMTLQRWNNNKPEHHVTDVFGAPENGQ